MTDYRRNSVIVALAVTRRHADSTAEAEVRSRAVDRLGEFRGGTIALAIHSAGHELPFGSELAAADHSDAAIRYTPGDLVDTSAGDSNVTVSDVLREHGSSFPSLAPEPGLSFSWNNSTSGWIAIRHDGCVILGDG
jgi:hypothetical protein